MRLHITLIGDVTLHRSPPPGAGDRPGPLAGPERVVLAALVLERVGGLDRDGLADLLWPDGLPKTWASALRTYVSRCRAALVTALGPEAGEGFDPLVRTGGRYAVAMPAGVDLAVDLEEAESGLAEARRRLAAGQPREARDLAAAAAAAMAGPFLAGWSGRWVDEVRARLDEVALGALELASQAALSAGDPSAALAAADEAVARAPLRESAQRHRLAALGAAGNRAEALRAYQRLRRALADEMGVDPAPETEAVYLDLLGPAPRVPAGHRGGLSAAGTVTGPSAQTPFVGRAAELAVLADAWVQAASGGRHVVMVTGEAGIGKSRLTAEAARRVSRDGGLVLFGRCDQEAIVPYQPVVEALDALVAAAPADELPAIGDEAMAELAAVLPSLDGRRRPGGSWPGGRGRLFGAVTDLVAATAKERPLLLVLDDLQWADDDTLLLVRHLLRRAGDAAVLVVAISRDHDIEPGNRLGDVVHALDRDGWVRRLPLRGLDEDEVRELVARLRGPEPGGADTAGGPEVARLVAETAGNPFLLTELLRAGAPAGIPAGVVDLVGTRLAGLGPGAVDLLRAGAVAGARFELDLVAVAAGLDDEDAVLDAVDAALASGLVVEESAERYRFPHDILRRTLVAQLSAIRRRALHDRLARAIERLRPGALDEYAAVLAHHTSAGATAGPAGDLRAVRWARRAAAGATARNAPAEAVRLCRQAVAHLPHGDAALAAEVTTDLGVALVAAHADDGVRTLLDGAALARAEGRGDVLGQAALALADAAEDQPELRAEARRLVDEAMAAAQPASPDDPGADPLRHAHLLVSRVRLAADDAPDDDDAAGPRPPRSALETLRARIDELGGPEYVEQRLRLADELAVLAERAQSPEHRVVAAHERAVAAATLGDEVGAVDALDALFAVGRRRSCRRPVRPGGADRVRGRPAHRQGRVRRGVRAAAGGGGRGRRGGPGCRPPPPNADRVAVGRRPARPGGGGRRHRGPVPGHVGPAGEGPGPAAGAGRGPPPPARGRDHPVRAGPGLAGRPRAGRRPDGRGHTRRCLRRTPTWCAASATGSSPAPRSSTSAGPRRRSASGGRPNATCSPPSASTPPGGPAPGSPSPRRPWSRSWRPAAARPTASGSPACAARRPGPAPTSPCGRRRGCAVRRSRGPSGPLRSSKSGRHRRAQAKGSPGPPKGSSIAGRIETGWPSSASPASSAPRRPA